MAHTPQGPGWWQASDGGWYPPELHPNHRPTPPSYVPPSYGPPTSPPYAQPSYGQPDSGQPPYGQPPYGQPPYGQPPYAQTTYGLPQYTPSEPEEPTRRSRRGLWLAIAGGTLVFALVTAVAATSGIGAPSSITKVIAGGQSSGGRNGSGTEPSRSTSAKAREAVLKVEIVGRKQGVEGDVTAAAIVDIEKYWTSEFPKIYGSQYRPIRGGFYSWSPGEQAPPCVEDPNAFKGNAFYCPTKDVVAWDDTGLIPHLYKTYGDLAVALVFAHEWGHAIQVRSGMNGETVTLEQQADCFAGAWVNHVRTGGSEYFTADGPALDRALGAVLEIGDQPGTSAADPRAHGSAFDRINAFQEGLESGGRSCVSYTDQSVQSRLVELQYTSEADYLSGGNAPYEEILGLSTADLEDYWSTVSKSEYGTTWKPLAAAQPFDSTTSKSPACGAVDTKGYGLFYCSEGRFIAYDNAKLFPQLYQQLGDFAVAALYGSQYSLAAEQQLGVQPKDLRKQNLMADCLTGSWAGSVYRGDRAQTAQLSMSPGDLDEAVKVLLVFGAKNAKDPHGSGFERVKAFRNGLFGGAKSCTATK